MRRSSSPSPEKPRRTTSSSSPKQPRLQPPSRRAPPRCEPEGREKGKLSPPDLHHRRICVVVSRKRRLRHSDPANLHHCGGVIRGMEEVAVVALEMEEAAWRWRQPR